MPKEADIGQIHQAEAKMQDSNRITTLTDRKDAILKRIKQRNAEKVTLPIEQPRPSRNGTEQTSKPPPRDTEGIIDAADSPLTDEDIAIENFSELAFEMSNHIAQLTDRELPRYYAISIYMRDIGKCKLLTREEEYQTIKAMKHVDIQYKENPGYNLNTNPFRQYMIKNNLPLVVAIANKYRGRGVPFLDLIQEGTTGLMKAVDTFDEERGYKFSTHAYWRIRRNVLRAIANHKRIIRLPVNVHADSTAVRKTVGLMQVDGDEPTRETIKKRLEERYPDKDEARLDEMIDHYETDYKQTPLSLDEPLVKDGVDTRGSFIPSPDPTPNEAAEKTVWHEELVHLVQNELSDLNEREREITIARFGLGGRSKDTLATLAKRYGISREMVRKYEKNALKRLEKSRVLWEVFEEN